MPQPKKAEWEIGLDQLLVTDKWRMDDYNRLKDFIRSTLEAERAKIMGRLDNIFASKYEGIPRIHPEHERMILGAIKDGGSGEEASIKSIEE